MVDRYRSPNDGMITTIFLPANSFRLATWAAAQSAPPDEIPARIPSSAAARLAYLTASAALTSRTSS